MLEVRFPLRFRVYTDCDKARRHGHELGFGLLGAVLQYRSQVISRMREGSAKESGMIKGRWCEVRGRGASEHQLPK